MESLSLAVFMLVCLAAFLAGQSPSGQARPTYRSGVDLVTMTAVVHDREGRPVEGLSGADFELFDAAERRAIVDVRSEPSRASVAILLDGSGSMKLGQKLATATGAVGDIVNGLVAGEDEVAIYTFDSGLREQRPFGPASPDVMRQLAPIEAFGSTALYDAIAQVGQRVVARRRSRRAVVVLTDGVDTSSQMTASEVSQAASLIDVPVYVIAVAAPLEDSSDAARRIAGAAAAAERPLAILARRTGGLLFPASVPSDASMAARQITTELHHQYQITFEPGSQAGWHALTLRIPRREYRVRARSGYVAGRHPDREPHSTTEKFVKEVVCDRRVESSHC